jgi:hypothetical protein
MIHAVEGSREVKRDQQRGKTRGRSREEVIKNFEASCLSRATRPVGRLKLREGWRLQEVWLKTSKSKTFKKFTDCPKVGNRPIG